VLLEEGDDDVGFHVIPLSRCKALRSAMAKGVRSRVRRHLTKAPLQEAGIEQQAAPAIPGKVGRKLVKRARFAERLRQSSLSISAAAGVKKHKRRAVSQDIDLSVLVRRNWE